MLFNSLQFLIFFPIVTAVYYLIAHRYRWAWLLAASCYFYMAFRPIYILILAFTILIDYVAGIMIENAPRKHKLTYLVISILANVGVLAVFKYYNFFTSQLNLHFASDIPLLNILLPIGLSFHTFQAMSYTIEIYRGHQKAERHLGLYALFVMFYPQLVAGPIERPQYILPQFRQVIVFNYNNLRFGLLLMAWGLFKKVAIADRLSIFVDQVYAHPGDYPGISIAIATIFYAFQILCDFSGYSDIAVGSAQAMGITMVTNFRQPYSSRSISEFWRRWHISLSSWFRDYVYIPLGGSQVSLIKNCRNYLIIFFLSGLWHGANWNFILWGLLHGLYLIFGRITRSARNKLAKAMGINSSPAIILGLQTLLTFSLVTYAWIFFRADYADTASMWKMVGGLWKNWPSRSDLTNLEYLQQFVFLGQRRRHFLIAILLLLFLGMVHRRQRHHSIRETIVAMPAVTRWLIYFSLVLATLYLGAFDNPEQFIYFQF